MESQGLLLVGYIFVYLQGYTYLTAEPLVPSEHTVQPAGRRRNSHEQSGNHYQPASAAGDYCPTVRESLLLKRRCHRAEPAALSFDAL